MPLRPCPRPAPPAFDAGFSAGGSSAFLLAAGLGAMAPAAFLLVVVTFGHKTATTAVTVWVTIWGAKQRPVNQKLGYHSHTGIPYQCQNNQKSAKYQYGTSKYSTLLGPICERSLGVLVDPRDR